MNQIDPLFGRQVNSEPPAKALKMETGTEADTLILGAGPHDAQALGMAIDGPVDENTEITQAAAASQ
eukprot:12933855-Prorocentrum_lima.AAC.1